MGIVSSMMNASIAVDTGANAVKKSKNELKTGINKYDTVLNNKIIKAPTNGGELGALTVNPNFRTASEQIDFLYKVAKYNDQDFNAHNNNRRHSNDRRQNDNRRPNRNQSVRDERIERSPSTLVVVEPKTKKKVNPYILAGGSVLGAAALQALTSKDFVSPLSTIKKSMLDYRFKLPKQMLSKNKEAKNVFTTIKKVDNNIKKQLKQDVKNSEKIKDAVLTRSPKPINKTASDKSQALKKVKRMFRDDFIRTGIETIPYYAAPATLSYLIGKNLSHPEDDPGIKRVIVDVPTIELTKKKKSVIKPMKKKASYDYDMPWKEWAREQIPRKTVQGLSRSIFPAIVVGITGRNIKGRLEKLEKKHGPSSVPEGETRIIIETSIDPKTGKPKLMQEKIASEERTLTPSEAIEKRLEALSLEEKEKKAKIKERAATNYNKLRSGVLKQVRMQSMQ